MSQSVLITIPDELVEDFINHLGRMKPEKAKHITIRVLDDDISVPHTREEHYAPQYPFHITDRDYLEELEEQDILDQIERQYQ